MCTVSRYPAPSAPIGQSDATHRNEAQRKPRRFRLPQRGPARRGVTRREPPDEQRKIPPQWPARKARHRDRPARSSVHATSRAEHHQVMRPFTVPSRTASTGARDRDRAGVGKADRDLQRVARHRRGAPSRPSSHAGRPAPAPRSSAAGWAVRRRGASPPSPLVVTWSCIIATRAPATSTSTRVSGSSLRFSIVKYTAPTLPSTDS